MVMMVLMMMLWVLRQWLLQWRPPSAAWLVQEGRLLQFVTSTISCCSALAEILMLLQQVVAVQPRIPAAHRRLGGMRLIHGRRRRRRLREISAPVQRETAITVFAVLGTTRQTLKMAAAATTAAAATITAANTAAAVRGRGKKQRAMLRRGVGGRGPPPAIMPWCVYIAIKALSLE